MSTVSSNYLLESSREYAIYVCDTRGIPYVTDGLKTGQRMALWLLRNRAEKMKTFALAGLLLYEKLYVHGDASANSAIGLLAAPYKNNHCLIEGLGQFGSRIAPDGDGIGAPRYTEVRRSKAAEAFLYQDLDLVPLEDNYDGSTQQPKHFLPLIPIVLLNGVSGVAVGWSTDILPRSLKALIEATKAAMMGLPVPVLEPHYARYNITVKPTGKPNQWELSGQAEIVDHATVRITELPPGLSIEAFRKRLAEMEDEEQIVNFADRSTENIDITVKLKRGTTKDWTKEHAIDFFKLREKTTERIVVVDWGRNGIRTYDTAEQLVVDFAAWRLGWYTKRYEKFLRDDSYELIYWYALRALFANGFPQSLGTFSTKEAMEAKIMEITGSIGIDASQLERIVNLPTYRWTEDFRNTVNKRITELEAAVSSHQTILASPDKLKRIYIDELDRLKSFKG